jgi:uncharacterized protein (TIGR03435 family)
MKWRLICLVLPLFAAPAQPVFDAASVRIHTGMDAETPRNSSWLQSTKGGVTIRNAKLAWCLQWAYCKSDWLISGPTWLFLDRYDIAAKSNGPASTAQLKLMMQALLTERFRLTLHHQMKELPVTELAVGKNGPKNLQPAAEDGPPDGPRPISSGKAIWSLIYKNVSMADFCERLAGPPPMGLGARVVDGTGIEGVFDITLNLNVERALAGTEDFAIILQLALDHQLGLKLVDRKMPVDTLVIDGGSRIPIEN